MVSASTVVLEVFETGAYIPGERFTLLIYHHECLTIKINNLVMLENNASMVLWRKLWYLTTQRWATDFEIVIVFTEQAIASSSSREDKSFWPSRRRYEMFLGNAVELTTEVIVSTAKIELRVLFFMLFTSRVILFTTQVSANSQCRSTIGDGDVRHLIRRSSHWTTAELGRT